MQREFNLKKTIGVGGQGTVWEAESPTGERVAYKVYAPSPNSTDESTDKQRFTREIQTQSILQHSNIVAVIESGTDNNGYPFYVMPLADCSLQKLVDEKFGGLSKDRAYEIFGQICGAMAYAHSQNILHRDLKPSNVLMFDTEPSVADFGLGKDLNSGDPTYTQSLLMQGSLGYMAPEQQEGLNNARKPADVYALGKVLWHILTGKDPSRVELAALPEEIRFLVHRATKDDPSERYQDAGELLAAFELVRGADSSVLAAPMDQAKAALASYSRGEDSLDNLMEVLITHSEDVALYTNFVPSIPGGVLTYMASAHPKEARAVFDIFDSHTESNSSFEYADTIAKVLESIFRGSVDYSLKEKILERLFWQGYTNNRFYVGARFASICSDSWQDPFYAQVVANLISQNRVEAEFFRGYLERYSIPQIVAEAYE
ncbi:serine/threonine-protein kinase [Nocardia asteroides]|uniref:serine/threonine-protein kinase n=1 Tax=Nocardia asteroides TaxID=1824 RepID=UPI001E34CFB8|nr:serine/threonine-protein kinase [Nocardia asteroides]UGT58336.1 serine/threonine protein kinase [Nocardia asteroides]